MTPKVSMIVPVYRTGKTLGKCLDSLTNQTLREIEIILIDDGSPDCAGELCDQYRQRDGRIRVIHQPNGGLSSARNAGLELARGEYVGFLDSDDYAALSMLEKLYANAVENRSDIAVCAHYTVRGDQVIPHLFKEEKSIFTGVEVVESWICPLLGADQIAGSASKEGFVWRNLYKRDILKNKRFRSEKTYLLEDIVFNLEVYKGARRVTVVNQPLIYYVYHQGSLTNCHDADSWPKLLNLLRFEKEYIGTNNLGENATRRLWDTTLKFFVFSSKKLKSSGPAVRTGRWRILESMVGSDCMQQAVKGLPWAAYPMKSRVLLGLLSLKLYRLIYLLM